MERKRHSCRKLQATFKTNLVNNRNNIHNREKRKYKRDKKEVSAKWATMFPNCQTQHYMAHVSVQQVMLTQVALSKSSYPVTQTTHTCTLIYDAIHINNKWFGQVRNQNMNLFFKKKKKKTILIIRLFPCVAPTDAPFCSCNNNNNNLRAWCVNLSAILNETTTTRREQPYVGISFLAGRQ